MVTSLLVHQLIYIFSEGRGTLRWPDATSVVWPGSSPPAVPAEAGASSRAWQCVNVERVPAHHAAGVRSNSPKVAGPGSVGAQMTPLTGPLFVV